MKSHVVCGSGYCLVVLLVLVACSSNTGPSTDKVRLDVKDRIQRSTQGLISLANFAIDDREVLAEDRVKFHITVSFKADPARIKAYNKGAERSVMIFGTLGGPSMRPVKIAQRMDGHTLKFTWYIG